MPKITGLIKMQDAVEDAASAVEASVFDSVLHFNQPSNFFIKSDVLQSCLPWSQEFNELSFSPNGFKLTEIDARRCRRRAVKTPKYKWTLRKFRKGLFCKRKETPSAEKTGFSRKVIFFWIEPIIFEWKHVFSSLIFVL